MNAKTMRTDGDKPISLGIFFFKFKRISYKRDSREVPLDTYEEQEEDVTDR